MDVNLIFRIAGVGILISVLGSYLKQHGKDDQAQLLTLAGVAVVLALVVQAVGRMFDSVRAVFKL